MNRPTISKHVMGVGCIKKRLGVGLLVKWGYNNMLALCSAISYVLRIFCCHRKVRGCYLVRFSCSLTSID